MAHPGRVRIVSGKEAVVAQPAEPVPSVVPSAAAAGPHGPWSGLGSPLGLPEGRERTALEDIVGLGQAVRQVAPDQEGAGRWPKRVHLAHLPATKTQS